MKQDKNHLMTAEHYENILKEIDDLKSQCNEINSGRKTAWDAGAGDGWDSPEFEEIERQEGLVIAQIKKRIEILANATIIEKQNNEDVIDIDDIVRLTIISGCDEDEETYKLTGGEAGFQDGLICISINSPIGRAIYQKKVGDKTSYQVKDKHGQEINSFQAIIREKIKPALHKENQL